MSVDSVGIAGAANSDDADTLPGRARVLARVCQLGGGITPRHEQGAMAEIVN